MERFRAAYRYFACPQRKDGNKSMDSIKKEKGKINSKKPLKSDNMVSSCCSQLGKSSGKISAPTDQPEKSKTECTSQRCITEDNEPTLAAHGQECSSPSTSEGSELMAATVKPDNLAPSETCLKKELSQSNCINKKSSDSDRSAGIDCRSNLETESAHQIVCSDTSATSCNCKPTEDASDLHNDNHPNQELCYVFDKFILTSGKVRYSVNTVCKIL